MMTTQSTHASLAAQRLNQKGAYCIETGRYDRAISNLVKAMQYCKQIVKNCKCQECTLEACVEYSHRLIQENKKHHGSTSTPSSPSLSQHSHDDHLSSFGPQETDADDNEEAYIYRVPLLTPQSTLGHSMRTVLPKIITFNLALAHQLKALTEDKKNNDQDARNRYKIVAKLYQLVYNNEIKEKSKASLFISLVAANNLADIHRRFLNQNKYESCLKFVLSAILLMGYDTKQNNDSYCNKVELEGFFWNATSLILKPTCAPVA